MSALRRKVKASRTLTEPAKCFKLPFRAHFLVVRNPQTLEKPIQESLGASQWLHNACGRPWRIRKYAFLTLIRLSEAPGRTPDPVFEQYECNSQFVYPFLAKSLFLPLERCALDANLTLRRTFICRLHFYL